MMNRTSFVLVGRKRRAFRACFMRPDKTSSPPLAGFSSLMGARSSAIVE